MLLSPAVLGACSSSECGGAESSSVLLCGRRQLPAHVMSHPKQQYVGLGTQGDLQVLESGGWNTHSPCPMLATHHVLVPGAR